MFISTRKNNFTDRIWIIIADIVALWVAIYLAASIRFGMLEAGGYINDKAVPLTASIFLYITIFYLMGLYELRGFKGYLSIITRAAISVISGILLTSFVFYATFSFAIGRGVFILMALLLLIFLSIPRVIYIFIAKKNFFDNRLIIIGSGGAAVDAVDLIKKNPTSLYKVIGVVCPEDECKCENKEGLLFLGSIKDIERISEDNKADVIVLTTLEPERNNILKNIRICRYQGVEIIDLVSLYEELEGRIPLKYIDDEWLFSSNVNYPKFHIRKLKRLVDILVSIFGLIITFPVCLIVAGIIKFESPGPIFYLQKRVGRFGRTFRIIKFRSMQNRAEKGMGGPVWAKDNDIRVTRIGKWIRKTRIDEIPQLINVLLGNMSLVGPRPERPAFVKELTEKIPYYPERLYVQPGLTGWAQIKYPYAATIEETTIKLEYDLYYIKHVAFFMDFYIMIKTMSVIFMHKGK